MFLDYQWLATLTQEQIKKLQMEYDSMSEQKDNYNSHKWNSVRDPYTMEWHTSCLVCGIEDLGDPDEFDIDYPACDESVIVNDKD